MNLNKIYDYYKYFEKVFEEEQEKYINIISREGKTMEDLERLGNFIFTPEEKETIARLNFAIGEVNKYKEIAIFASYFGKEFKGLEKFEAEPGFNEVLSSIKNPQIILVDTEEGFEEKIKDEQEWKAYKEMRIEDLKRQYQFVEEQIKESDKDE